MPGAPLYPDQLNTYSRSRCRSLTTDPAAVRYPHFFWPVGRSRKILETLRKLEVPRAPRTLLFHLARSFHAERSRSYWVVTACASGRSVTWCEYRTPQVSGADQVRPARARALREYVRRLVRPAVPRQVSARRARPLTRLAAAAAARPALRRLPPWQVIGARRHRRVPRVAGDQPLQPRDPLLQRRDLRVLVLHQHPQLPDPLSQPRVPRAQLICITGHTGSLGRTGHPGTTSEPALREQRDTPGRPAGFPGASSCSGPGCHQGPAIRGW